MTVDSPVLPRSPAAFASRVWKLGCWLCAHRCPVSLGSRPPTACMPSAPCWWRSPADLTVVSPELLQLPFEYNWRTRLFAKIADQISDAVLDEILKQDLEAHVACETFVKTGMVLVGGEITTSAWVDIENLVRNVVCDIGYNHSDIGFDANSCAVLNAIGKQSGRPCRGVGAARPPAEASRNPRIHH